MTPDAHLADALTAPHPRGVTTNQVNDHVAAVIDDLHQLRTLVRTIATVVGFTFGLATIEAAYLLWGTR